MTWLIEISKIKLEEQVLIKYYVLKYLILPKIQNIIDIKGVLLQRFINFKIKKLSSGDVKSEYMPDQQLAEELQKI